MAGTSRLASIPSLVAALGLVWVGCGDQITYLECPLGTTPSGDQCEEIPDAAPGDEGRTFVAPCDPGCDDKECGDDGCGGTCGTCPEIAPACGDDGLCHLGCIPDCEGRECGPDGCVGSCGTCPEAAPTCGPDGQCQLSCIPDCAGRECGGDGCGGTCGTCPAAAPTCGADGQCTLDCTPDCEGKQCGDDGCGGSCGECAGACVNEVQGTDFEGNLQSMEEYAWTLGNLCMENNPGNVAGCIQDAMAQEFGLGSGCALCFAGYVVCTLSSCSSPCFNYDSPQCVSCRTDLCIPTWAACMGF